MLRKGAVLHALWGMLLVGSSATVAQADEIARVSDGFDIAANDWPWWRGPQRDGTAARDQQPPLSFDDTKNVIWKSKIPGRGHGSATVVGDQVYVATANEESGAQLLLCFDRATGETNWQTVVHESGGLKKNKKSTAASATPACDGERVYICFPTGGSDDAGTQGKLVASALTLDGEIVWQQTISNYVVHQGYGASPALYQEMVIVSSDNKKGGMLAALNRKTGEFVWQRERPELPNYPSPTLLHVNGQDQLIMVGGDQIVSYDPNTGKTNWQTEGATTECVTSTLTDGKHIYTSGGYPKNHMSAIRADGSGAMAWENKTRLYVPSLVIRDGYLYGVLDAGIATCWEAATGEEMWKARLGGTFSSSPVLVGDRVFVCNEGGEFFVFRARPDQYEEIAKSQLGSQVFATPTIVGSRIFHRVAQLDASGNRQEWLYCIGEE